jgi:putative hydrolase of the HAD superfamily
MPRLNIVFDFGAVLFDWRPMQLITQRWPQHCATPEAAYHLARQLFHHRDWYEFDSGLRSTQDTAARMATRLGLPLHEVHDFIEPIGRQLQPIACNVQLLHQLAAQRGAPSGPGQTLGLYYLSNMPAPYARELEQRHTFIQQFDGGIFSGDVLLAKPQRKIYELLMQRYQLQPRSVLFIDDHRANTQAAERLGWRTIHCQAPEQLPAQFMNEIGRWPA